MSKSNRTPKILLCLIALFTVMVAYSADQSTINAATLTVDDATLTAPSITMQPVSADVTAGQAATFSIVADDTLPLSYQWQKNGAAISGANSSVYTTPPTTSSDDRALFTVVVTNSVGSVTSTAGTLNVAAGTVVAPPITTQPGSQTGKAPSITMQPVSADVTAGQTAAFSIVADGDSPLSYQWQKNGVAISGANSSVYTTPPATSSDDHALFTVVVTNGVGSVTSTAGTLNVAAGTAAGTAAAPSITTQPFSQTVTAGQTATFTVAATGTSPLSYQWQKNGGPIPGATSSDYTTSPATPADNGAQFTVVVSNAAGSVTSAAAGLTIASVCVQSSASWTNSSIPLETAPFMATYNATPSQANMSGVLGFSLNATTGFTSLAAIVRFNANGFIDVRNGSAYSADVSVPYFPGVSYQFRWMIDPSARQYSVYVTPSGASEIALATSYTFRSDQSALTSLNNWATTVSSGSGSLSACNMTIVPAAPLPLPASYLLSANPSVLNFGSIYVSNSGTLPVTLTNSGNSDISVSNVSVVGAGMYASGVYTGQTIPAGQSATLNVTFAPAASGTVAGNITIASNATNSPATIQFSGTGVTAVTHSVSLSWNPSISDVTSYNVYRGAASGGPYGILASQLSGTAYIDTSVQNGTTYFYVVTAVDAQGIESDFSNEAAAAAP